MSRPAATVDRERRMVPVGGLEVRVSGEGEPPRIEGYAAVFNQPSEVLDDFWFGGFREYISPGAFTKTLKDGADVRALLNHDPNFVLGRTRAGTLTLKEDDKGLFYSVTPPDTSWARDLIATMRRGDIDQSSFAFRTVRDRWGVGQTDDGDEIDERWVLEAALFDVSPVTYPAYPQTSSDVRALLTEAGFDSRVLPALDRARRGLPLREADVTLIRTTINRLSAYLEATPPAQAGHDETPRTPEPAPSGHSVSVGSEPAFIDPQRAARLRKHLERHEALLRGHGHGPGGTA